MNAAVNATNLKTISSRIRCPILCDGPGPFQMRIHYVRLRDGVVTTDCKGADEKATRLVTMALLGHPLGALIGCVGLAAALRAIPHIQWDGGADPVMGRRIGVPQAFKEVYEHYRTNPLFTMVVDRHREQLLTARADLDKKLMKTLYRQLRQHFAASDIAASVARGDIAFAYDVPVEQLRRGWTVASHDSDDWTVPYQDGWLDTVYKPGLATGPGGSFVCGLDPSNPRILYTIEHRDSGGFHVVPRERTR